MGSKNQPGGGGFQSGKRRSDQPGQLFNGRNGVLLFQIRSAGRLTARAGERALLSR